MKQQKELVVSGVTPSFGTKRLNIHVRREREGGQKYISGPLNVM
jgi:hypothetical protein